MMAETGARSQASGFRAILAASAAIEQRQPAALNEAIESASHTAVLRAAARHRCLGYLRREVLKLGVRSQRTTALVDALRAYAAKAVMQAFAVRRQLDDVVSTLNEAHIRFALLKGAARLFRGDREADSDTMYDLDILVPKDELTMAMSALRRKGYRSVFGRQSLHYWSRHHHAAPLQPEQLGLPIELHFHLAPPYSLSKTTNWDACETYLERVVGVHGEADCFDELGTALHLTIHGVGIRRLHDVIMLSRILRADRRIGDRLVALVDEETWQPVALKAVIVLAARIAALDIATTPAVQSYLEWVIRREDLSPYVRDRTQFVDAWYTNGGRLWGPATRLALPMRDTQQSPVAFGAIFAYRLIGRIAASAYAAAAATRRSAAAP